MKEPPNGVYPGLLQVQDQVLDFLFLLQLQTSVD
jgi:hypothetical protein